MLLADAISLMLGGFHTTGNFMTWTLHYLSLYPDIQEKVFAELSEVFPEPEAEVDEADMKKLVYVSSNEVNLNGPN